MELVMKGRLHLRLPLFGWLSPFVSLMQLHCAILWLARSLEEPVDIFDILLEIIIKEM